MHVCRPLLDFRRRMRIRLGKIVPQPEPDEDNGKVCKRKNVACDITQATDTSLGGSGL
jgi:hypothetical protein